MGKKKTQRWYGIQAAGIYYSYAGEKIEVAEDWGQNIEELKKKPKNDNLIIIPFWVIIFEFFLIRLSVSL